MREEVQEMRSEIVNIYYVVKKFEVGFNRIKENRYES